MEELVCNIIEKESQSNGHNIFFVCPDGSNEEGKGTADEPYKTINYAIKQAQKAYDQDKSVNTYIYLYEGLYSEEAFIDVMTLGRLHIVGIDEDYEKVVIPNILFAQPLGFNENEYSSIQNVSIIDNGNYSSHGVLLDYYSRVPTKLTLINCHLTSEGDEPLIHLRTENNKSCLYLIDCVLDSCSDKSAIVIEKGNLYGYNNKITMKEEGNPILLHLGGSIQDFKGNEIEPKNRELIKFNMEKPEDKPKEETKEEEIKEEEIKEDPKEIEV